MARLVADHEGDGWDRIDLNRLASLVTSRPETPPRIVKRDLAW
ncbi:hypothetical protein ACWFMI_27640 [Nocardiopsis terrae]